MDYINREYKRIKKIVSELLEQINGGNIHLFAEAFIELDKSLSEKLELELNMQLKFQNGSFDKEYGSLLD